MSRTAPHADEPNRLVSLYAMAVRLYPGPFREAYGTSLKQTFRDSLDDRTLSRRTLIPLVLRDLATSLVKEHFIMLRDTFGRPALIFNALVLAGTLGAGAFGIVASQGDCLEHDNEQRKTHGELWKEIVKRGSESKMKAVNKKCVAHNSVLGVSSQAQH